MTFGIHSAVKDNVGGTGRCEEPCAWPGWDPSDTDIVQESCTAASWGPALIWWEQLWQNQMQLWA